ncbi:carbohydrate ABC transporter permease [Coraliomargarita parva]|uniref:carbohydrate ABC transporter permease n=1 Tax=Coraliomargarita parva TaxID=3014050 RepID=UPI0022B2CF95|nr:sugar ABC transporter permease [Coraliomargarita parva]
MPPSPEVPPITVPDADVRGKLRAKFFQKSKLFLALYLLVLPTTLSLLVFSYYPKFDVFLMSFFRWQPPTVQEFVGLRNFKEAFSDPMFWQSFKLVGILLVANLVKLWPGILAAIALNRIKSDKLRYFIQVCFVVPMIVPAMVFLLIWKNFYDPDFGLVNRFLNMTGGMRLLDWMDTAMPQLAQNLAPIQDNMIAPVFGSVGGLIILGAYILAASRRKEHDASRWGDYAVLLAGAMILPVGTIFGLQSSPSEAKVYAVGLAFLAWMFACARRMGSSWIAWPFLLFAGVGVFWQELWRLPLALSLAFGIAELIRAKKDAYQARPWFNVIAGVLIACGIAFIFLGNIWTEPTEQFAGGTPAWLGNKDLVIPAILFWGFPWVGTVGVLIYLSGLQNISQDVYEAAKLDGVSPLGMIFKIELPLIMTQVRINLIFMTIHTLSAYEIYLILLGPEGGPGAKGMVPGLYMFGSAFSEGRFGYACALGMVLFAIILMLTIVYQKYVKVDK